MYLYADKGDELFRGRVFYNERFGEQGTIQVTCNDLGISVETLASTGISQKMLCSNMNMYEIIKGAYEVAGSQNGKRYSITMEQGKLCVEQVGSEVINYALRVDTNIIESSYSENAEGVVNKVKIYDL